MNNAHTEIVFVLARSGSMQAMIEHFYTSSKGALSRKMSSFRRSSQGDIDTATVHGAASPLESPREQEERKDRK
jgi:hypothetical protein